MLSIRLLVRQRLQCRHLLTDAFNCRTEWEESITSGRVGKMDSYDVLSELEKRFAGGARVSGVDIDIASLALSDVDQLEQFKGILYSFRHCAQAHTVMESTHHNIVRKCLDFKAPEFVLDLLKDPINYGLFPDRLACNLIMDWFLEREQFAEAAKIAIYLMKQELLENPLTCWLSIYSCARSWEEGSLKEKSETEAEAAEEADEDEELVLKFPFLKNPYHDGHFDLTESNQMLGKTLLWAARGVASNEASTNARLLGLLLMQKIDQAKELMQEMASGKTKISQNLASSIDTFTPQEEGSEQEEKTVVPCESSELGVSAVVLRELRREVAERENESVQEMSTTLKAWSTQRKTRLEQEIERESLKEELKRLDVELAESVEEEKLMEFFHDRDSLEDLHGKESQVSSKWDDSKPLLSDDEFAKLLPQLKAKHISKNQ